MCSKCWNENQKKDQTCDSTNSTATSTPMEVDSVQCSPVPAETRTEASNTPAASVAEAEAPMEIEAPVVKKSPKKKKKKASYKSMMAGMTQRNNSSSIEKDKAELRKVTGGGAFSKIDKI